MAPKRAPARQAARPLPDGTIWIDHAFIEESDIEWLGQAERLTLWNVRVPSGFLTKLERLWWLDIRGGTAENLSLALDAPLLRFLGVRSVRGMLDLSALIEFRYLEFLQIGGLHQIAELPSFAPLRRLLRVEIGPMRGLRSLAQVLDAPSLLELFLIRRIQVTDDDIRRINSHPSLTHFGWFAEDVPDRQWVPVVRQIELPEAPTLYVDEWFERMGKSGPPPSL